MQTKYAIKKEIVTFFLHYSFMWQKWQKYDNSRSVKCRSNQIPLYYILLSNNTKVDDKHYENEM